MKRIMVVALLFLGLSGVFAQKTVFEKEKVIDSISVPGTEETFALYLPSSYEPNTLSSVIFIFEPTARGKFGVEQFIQASERYNHILVSSNFTQNFNKDNFDVINRLFDTVFSTFSIDEKQIYTAGFSGGSRLATTVAVLTNQIEGVIGCGAGFSPNAPETPNPSHTFSYVGLVGTLDMNYHEMYNATAYLGRINLENELFTNGDPHKWPEPKQLSKAIGFLELQAYKKNRKPKSKAIIKSLYEEWYRDGQEAENRGECSKAVEVYERLRRNFSRYYDLDSITAKIKSLRSKESFKTEEKLRADIQTEEDKVKNVFLDRIKKELNAVSQSTRFKWWKKELEKFRKKYSESDKLVLRELGARIENMLFVAVVENAQVGLRDKNMKKALYCHHLLETMQPEKVYPQFLLAKDYALANNKEKMFEHLYLAKEKGLTKRKYIENEEAFQAYKNDPEFIEFLKGLN
ncbi:TPR end-of-group domain-containing protein [Aureisphaera galaxeae]|uniref:TPR end-of-group domain-containing protein n=1 Tax=Aureisphaera galaxeae TaxID=1538023 RepID=UPI0023502EE1|nr:hypothetical protein [Aureisphaera galaxeae]